MTTSCMPTPSSRCRSNPAFPSLNLAQCVLLMAYEWRRQGPPPEAAPEAEAATHQEVEKLADHYDAELDAAGFFFPPQKAPRMRRNLRNLWSRLPLTRADVQVLPRRAAAMVRRPDAMADLKAPCPRA